MRYRGVNENQEEYEWVRVHSVRFARGCYFARPGVPPTMLGGDPTTQARDALQFISISPIGLKGCKFHIAARPS